MTPATTTYVGTRTTNLHEAAELITPAHELFNILRREELPIDTPWKQGLIAVLDLVFDKRMPAALGLSGPDEAFQRAAEAKFSPYFSPYSSPFTVGVALTGKAAHKEKSSPLTLLFAGIAFSQNALACSWNLCIFSSLPAKPSSLSVYLLAPATIQLSATCLSACVPTPAT